MKESLARIGRSHSPFLGAITRPTEPPSQHGHHESPRKTHALSSNILAAPKISQSQHLGYTARNRPRQPGPSQQSPTRPPRPALSQKPNNAHVLTFTGHHPSNNGREDTGTSAKNTPTAQGSDNIVHGDAESLPTGSPDRMFKLFLGVADDQGVINT